MLVPSIIKFAMISFLQPLSIHVSVCRQSGNLPKLIHLLSSSDTILFPEKFSFADANPSLTDYTSFPKSKMDTRALIRSDAN